MKTALVPVEPHDTMEATLHLAYLWASAFGSYVEGLALRPALPAFVGADALGATLPYVYPERDEEVTAAARKTFESFMTERGVPPIRDAGEGPSFGWLESVIPGDPYVGIYGRAFDITIVGRPNANLTGPRMSTLESALFESGRPILIAPPVAPTGLGERILIAWNGSTETARAIAFAMPVLKRATQIVVLTVVGGTVPDPAATEIVSHLRRNGVPAEARSVNAGQRTVGETVLAEAAALGAGLVIKGAYTQSRLRQMIFGGSTRHIIGQATLPVFMAH